MVRFSMFGYTPLTRCLKNNQTEGWDHTTTPQWGDAQVLDSPSISFFSDWELETGEGVDLDVSLIFMAQYVNFSIPKVSLWETLKVFL